MWCYLGALISAANPQAYQLRRIGRPVRKSVEDSMVPFSPTEWMWPSTKPFTSKMWSLSFNSYSVSVVPAQHYCPHSCSTIDRTGGPYWFFSILVRLRNPDQTVIWVWKMQRACGDGAGRGILLYYELTSFHNQARRRRYDCHFQSSRGLDCLGVVTHNWHKNTENRIPNLELIGFKVLMVCLVTGCVSWSRGAR